MSPRACGSAFTSAAAGLAAVSLLVAGLLAPARASGPPSSGATPSATETAGQEANAPASPRLIPRGKVVDPRADTTPITFIVGLKRDNATLTTEATRRANPDELVYRDFLPLVDAGKAYGASSKTLKKARNAAKRAGLKIQIDPSRLFARLTGTAATWNDVLETKVEKSSASQGDPYTVYTASVKGQFPPPPADFRSSTTEWLTVYAIYEPQFDNAGVDQSVVKELQDLLASPGSPQAWPRSGGTLPSGTCDAPALTSGKVYAPGQLSTAYGADGLAKRRMTGKDTRLAIVSLGGGFNGADLEAAADCFGFTMPPVNVVTTSGVSAPFVNASIETHLDLMTSAAVLPNAESIHLVEAVDTLVGFVNALATTLDLDGAPADVVSISYGACEYDYASGSGAGPLMSLMEDLLRMAAVVGTSVVVAAGDNGTSTCAGSVADQPTVSYPASSPWVTAVGGTRLALNSDNTRKSEVVWNDLPFVGTEPAPGPAGAGGPSAFFARPSYQGGVTPVGPRMLPDIALLADIRPGWPIVYGDLLGTVGGTSGASPFFAAHLALIAAKERSRGYPVLGFVNTWLYEAAGTSTNPFYDVVSGSNAVEMTGCCSAYAGYDMASGLGAPSMDLLYRSLPSPAG